MRQISPVVALDELAKRLHLSKRWLHREATAGRLPSLRAGKQRLFNVEAVRRALGVRAARPSASEGVSRGA